MEHSPEVWNIPPMTPVYIINLHWFHYIIHYVTSQTEEYRNISNINNEQAYERMRNKYRYLVPFLTI